MFRTSIGSCRRRERRGTFGNLGLELVFSCLSFISDNFLFHTLDNLASRYHEAVEGFFGASQGRPDNTSFEGGNKSGATALAC
jgi:hypothetical protein